MSGDDTGRMTAHELGMIMGKLEGIHRSQSKMERQLDTQTMEIAAIRTDVALIKSEQVERKEEIASIDARVSNHSRDIARIRGSWKMSAVKYIGTGSVGA